ncbi:hypothetical protein MHA_0571 [Mannheimia haemolytica PHL213]|nr:hypothetical protein MHA_0571 [Mannheimia haemolytica PHL213]
MEIKRKMTVAELKLKAMLAKPTIVQ